MMATENEIRSVVRNFTAMKAVEDVLTERLRQIDVEGHSYQKDDKWKETQLAKAAICYAIAAVIPFAYVTFDRMISFLWPWDWKFWKAKDKTPRQRLVVATALLIAEIERMDREEQRKKGR